MHARWWLLAIALAVAAGQDTAETWASLYALRVQPDTFSLTNVAWLWTQMNADTNADTTLPSTMTWPTSASEWQIAARTLEPLCFSNPRAAVCVAACTRVPAWEFVAASEWDFCVWIQPERCFPRLPDWAMPHNRLCFNSFRKHASASNPLCPSGFVSAAAGNASDIESIKLWCGQATNASAITIIPSYKQLVASSPYQSGTPPSLVTAIEPKLIHNLPPAHRQFRWTTSGAVRECTLDEAALTTECHPIYDFISSQWPASYCTTLCGGAGTYAAANAQNSDGSPSTDICCYSSGCTCAPVDHFAEILEQGHTPFCLLVDSILSDTGTQPVSWWNQWRETNTFVSVAYRQEDAPAGAAKLGIAPNGLDVWLIKLWGSGQPGVTQDTSFCGRGRISDVRLCSAWGVFAGKCVPISSLISAVPLNDATDQPLTTSQTLIEGQPWFLPTQTSNAGTTEHVSCAVSRTALSYRQAANPTLGNSAWCDPGQYDWWGERDDVPCYCLPQSHLLSYDGRRDKVSLCSPTTPRGQCLLASGLVNAPLSTPGTVWGPRCYTTENDGAAKCAYTRAYRATNMLQNTAIAICAVRAFTTLGVEEGVPTLVGMYKDEANPRALPYQMPNIKDNHPTACQAECLSYAKAHGKTFTHFGIQDTTQCWCGESSDNYARYGTSTTWGYCPDGYGDFVCGGSWTNAVYTIAPDTLTNDRGGIHACRPSRYFRHFQITNKADGWGTRTSIAPDAGTRPICPGLACDVCQKWGSPGQTEMGCGPGTGTCEGGQPLSAYQIRGNDKCSDGDTGQGQAFFFPLQLEACSAGNDPSPTCWWQWEMYSTQTYVTGLARSWDESGSNSLIQLSWNARTEALDLCGSHAAYDSSKCPHGGTPTVNTASGHAMCALTPQVPSGEHQAYHTMCFPAQLMGDRYGSFLPSSAWQTLYTSVGAENLCTTQTMSGTITTNGLCMLGWTQWYMNGNYINVYANRQMMLRVMSSEYTWLSGSAQTPLGGWGSANAYQQAQRGYTTSQVTCGFTQYGNATNDAACAAIWSSSSALLSPPSFGFVDGLLWPTSFTHLAPGTATYAPSQLRSSIHPDTTCYFDWTGSCKTGYMPATNVATQTVCCFGESAMCNCYPASYTQREGVGEVGRIDSSWGAFSAQSQGARCPPSTGAVPATPVCYSLPRWCLDLPRQPCAASCAALGGPLATSEQGEAFVSCIRSQCDPQVLSGSASASWNDCAYGRTCSGTSYNTCTGCSQVNERLQLYNRSAAANSFQCIHMPHESGYAPVGIAGDYLEDDQLMTHAVACGANYYAPPGKYCQPCPINTVSSPGASACTACPAGTSRVVEFDLTSDVATHSWNCAQNPESCQPWGTSGSVCTPCQEGWQSNAMGLCTDCPGAYTLSPTWMGTTPQSLRLGLSPCIGCPPGEIRRLATAQCVNCGDHEHIVRVLPAAGTRLTYQELTRFGIASYVLPDATSSGQFESLFCDFSGSCPEGSVAISSIAHARYRYCAACPPAMQGVGCQRVCGWNQYGSEWGPGDNCKLCPAGTHAPVANHNHDTLQSWATIPFWAGAKYCETAYHPPQSPTGMVVQRDTAYASGWLTGALLNAPGSQYQPTPQDCVKSCVETEGCLAVTWVSSQNQCRMSHEDLYTQAQSGSNTWIKSHATTLTTTAPAAHESCLNLTSLTSDPVPADFRQIFDAFVANQTLIPTNTTPVPPADNWSLQLLWLSVAPQSPDLCVPCEKGTFGPPNVRTGGCFPCAPFHYANATGMTVCLPCPVNMYIETVGSSFCLPCPPNTSTNGTAGVPCRFANGTIATPPVGSEFCVPGTQIQAGVYNTQGKLVNLTCSDCPAGRISTGYDSVGCTVCQPGYTPAPDRTTCVMCQGQTRGVQGICEPCAPNTAASADHTTCAPCPAGQGRLKGQPECANCTDPRYSRSDASGCLLCPQGAEAWSNHTGCERCRPGFGRRGSQLRCTPCPTGMFANDDTLTMGCVHCARNHVSRQPGATSCERCPSDKISNRVVGGNACVNPFFSELRFLEAMSGLEQALSIIAVLTVLLVLFRPSADTKEKLA